MAMMHAHLKSDLGLFAFLLIARVDRLRLLSDDLCLRVPQIIELTAKFVVKLRCTFSIANSSSALTLISRAFSDASCLMNATYIGPSAEPRIRHSGYEISGPFYSSR